MGDSEQWGSSGGDPFGPDQQEDPRKRQWPPPQQQPLPQQQALPLPQQAQQQLLPDNSPRNAGGLSAMGQPAQDPFGPDQDTTTNPTGDRQPDQPKYESVPKRNIFSMLSGAGHQGGLLSVLGAVAGNTSEIQASQARNAMLQQEYENKIKLLNANAFNKMYGSGRGPTTFSQIEPGGPITAHPGFGRPDVPNAVIPSAVTKATPSGTPQKTNSDQYMTLVLQNPDDYPPEVAALATQYFKNKSTQRPFAPTIYNPLAPPPVAGQEPQPPPPAQLFDPNKGTLGPLPGATGPLARPAAPSAAATAGNADIHTTAQGLVAALHGDPTAVSTLRDLGGFGNKKVQLYAEAKRIDPTFNSSQLERMKTAVDNFTTSTRPGSGNMQLRSFNTFIQHAADLQDAVQNLTRTDSQLLNRPLGWVQQQAISDPKYTEFKAALMAPTMEYLRLLNNGGAPYERERNDISEAMPPSSTVKQIIGGTRQMAKTVEKRLNSVASEFRRGTGHDMWTTLPDAISPEARAAAAKLGVQLPGGNTAAGQPAQGGATPQTATDAKGNKIQWDGKAWTPVK